MTNVYLAAAQSQIDQAYKSQIPAAFSIPFMRLSPRGQHREHSRRGHYRPASGSCLFPAHPRIDSSCVSAVRSSKSACPERNPDLTLIHDPLECAQCYSTSPTREGTVSLHAFVVAQLSHGIKIGSYHVQRKAEMSVRAAHPQSESAQLRIRTPQRPLGLKSRPRVNAHKAHPIKSGKIGRISASSFRLSVRKS